MRKMKLFVLLALVMASTISKADEGMWLPFMIGRNMEDMKKHGLKLTQEQIYSINNASIKDAVISFGGFCTGEIISKKRFSYYKSPLRIRCNCRIIYSGKELFRQRFLG